MNFNKLLRLSHPTNESPVGADLSCPPPIMNFHDHDRQPRPQRPCCRDKGRGEVVEGALCLSWLECDPFPRRNPDVSCGDEDKPNAPARPQIYSLSLQDGGPLA